MSLWDEGLSRFLGDLRDRGVDKNTIDQFLRDKASSEDARQSCQSLQSDSNRKYGQVEVAGRQIPTKWISCIMDNINRFVSITDYAMKGAPETVGLAWFAVKQVLNAVQNNYKLYGFFGSALTDITEMPVIIRTYDKLYDERKKSSWKASDIVGELFTQIRNVYSAILDFSFSVKQHLTAGKMAKIGHAIKDALGSSSGEFEGKMSAITALKAKILESAQGAFQQKTFVKFEEVQETIKLVVEGQETSLQMQQAIQQSMEDLAKQTKPKSRDDYAKQEFEKNKKTLNPLPDSRTTFNAYLKQRQEGTCEWMFEHSEYVSWRNSTTSRMLCVDGEHGVGKSVLLASMINRLEQELSGDQDWVVEYLSCETIQNSTGAEARSDSSLSLARIQNTLIYHLYEFANSSYDGDTSILEKCNGVFKNPEKKKVTDGLVQHQRAGDLLPDLDEALESLAQVLDKKLFIVIDAVDMVPDAEQEAFLSSLQDVLSRTGLHVRILVSCFSQGKIYDTLDNNSTPHIALGDYNRADIDLTTKTKLGNMPRWSDAERKEALEAVLEKSGSDFKYAVRVAIPFLEEPWQRPLSNRLKQLPENLNETYNQALSQMASNYRALLQTSVTWALLANGLVTVTEVMDAHTGTYLVVDSQPEDFGSNEESHLHREQIRAAGGPFLDCQKHEKQSVIKLKDPAAVKRFFVRSINDSASEQKPDQPICAKCKDSTGFVQDLTISEKTGHLNLAITLVKHLNSPLFQKKYLKNIVAEDTKETARNDDVNEKSEDDAIVTMNGDTEVALKVELLTEAKLKEHNATESTEKASDEKGDIESSYLHSKDGAASTNGEEGKDDPDESQDSEDRGIEWDQGYQEDDAGPELENSASTRYEIRHWFTHVRKAESLWPNKEEREGSKEWAILFEELDCFIANERVFNAWLQGYLSDTNGWSPIHVAAHFGLTSLADRLLSKDHGADVMSLTEQGFTPLHVAAHADNRLEMMKLLLQHGAKANSESDASMIPAFLYWVLYEATGQEIQELLKHGSSCVMKDKFGLNVMHYFAWVGSKPEDLFLLLDHEGEGEARANINVIDNSGETALHKLLNRRDIPLDLLQAFLDRGADVNIDDEDSKRPLFQSAGQGELDAMKIIIDKVEDIDDDDKYGRTTMHNAAWAGHTEVVKFLIEKGASAIRTDKHNRTPFLFACLGKSEETARFLLDKVIELGLSIDNINMATKRGRTPLRQASAKGFTEVVEIILSKIDSPTVVNAVDTRKGRSALHCAAFRGKARVVEALLKKGADITLQDGVDGKGKTALQLCHEEWAIQGTKDFEDTLSLLIDHDQAAAAQDSLLLATAAVNGSITILEKLHKAQANLDKIDQYGWTPLLLARQFQHTVEFLSRKTKPTKWECEIESVKVAEDGRRLEHPGEDRFCIVANRPISSGFSRYYYEITILPTEGSLPNPEVAIGFCTLSAPSLLDFPGWPKPGAPSSKSWAYHGDNGGFYSYSSWNAVFLGEPYGPGDVIGCGVDFRTGAIWYTRNGKMIDQGFEKVMGRLFPVLGLHDKVAVEANFGNDLESKPFKWLEGLEIK